MDAFENHEHSDSPQLSKLAEAFFSFSLEESRLPFLHQDHPISCTAPGQSREPGFGIAGAREDNSFSRRKWLSH